MGLLDCLRSSAPTRDARALGSARANARRAGLAGRIQLGQPRSRGRSRRPRGASRAWWSPIRRTESGSGKWPSWSGLYETLGERLKSRSRGWEAAVFTANPELSAHLGLRARRVNVLFNGPLDAKLLVFDIGPVVRGRSGGGRAGASQAAD